MNYAGAIRNPKLKKTGFKKTKSSWLVNFCREQLFLKLNALHTGHLLIREHDEEFEFGNQIHELKAEIHVNDIHAYLDMVLGGSIGASEAYMTGDWSSPNLVAVIRLMALNMDVLDQVEGGLTLVSGFISKLYHYSNRNTPRGSRRNIAAHYDLGNELFELFLDPTMMYSSGIFETPEYTMEQASIAKLDRICRKLELSEDDHLVEIGTGWGGMAVYAAENFGCRVTTTTISDEQYRWAKETVRKKGLENRIEILLEDYRNLTGTYDKLVSIEMIEAVGYKFYPEYFKKCADLLKPNGKMLLQAITIEDQRYKKATKNVDFIQRYIFPGSCIPSVTAIQQTVSSHTDLRLTHLEDITSHYAETLKAWREQFFKNEEQVRALGYDDTFIRMWDFYLCYCEGGFREKAIGDVHMLFAKPLNRSSPPLGEL